MTSLTDLLAGPPAIVNVGLPSFAGPPQAHGAGVVDLEWRPPAAGDAALGLKLAGLIEHPLIEDANREATERMLDARPLWTDVQPAGDLLPELRDQRLLLHAGPPIAWDDMCGPMRAGVVGAALLEGWADTPEAAERLADSGGIEFSPCHHHDAVGPMGGIISASMPLIVAEDPSTGRRAYCNLNEGAGRALRYGALGQDVSDRLTWMSERLGPSLQAALRTLDKPIDLKSVTAQALQMGDECHSRNVASSALLTRLLAPGLARNGDLGGLEALDFLAHQRLLVPELLDGREQAVHSRRRRRRRLHRGHDPRAQRRESASGSAARAMPGSPLRPPRSTGCTSPAMAPGTPIATSATAR